MIIPPSLRLGDAIGIVSAARKISRDEIAHAIHIIEGYGYRVVIGESIGAEYHQFAGDDSLRAADFQQMLNNPEIKAILFARGGYGSVRIIDRIDFSIFQKNPKWIAGYSDACVVLLHVNAQMGIQTLHAGMPVNFSGIDKKNATITTLMEALSGNNISYNFTNHPLNRFGQASGRLLGGNLSIIYSLQASKSLPDFRQAILFIEDLDEYLYHIDRMINSLKRSSIFKSIAGLVVGGMSDMRDNAIPFGFSAEEIIREATEEYCFPVCFGFPAGHIKENKTLIMGREVNLDVNESFSCLRFLP